MKVYVTAPGETEQTVLADHGRTSVSQWAVRPAYNDQPLPRVRASYNRFADRGNLGHNISFNVSLEKSSIAEAQRMCSDHAQELPKEVDAYWVLEDKSTTRKMANALLRVTSISHRGVTVDVSYQLTGGEITNPDAP